MARYVVTGAAGFIGSQLVHELVRLGHEVIALDSFRFGVRDNLKDFKGILLKSNVVEGFPPIDFDGPNDSSRIDAIFHHGDITDPRHENPDEIVFSNTEGFKNILNYCLKNKIRLVFASSAGIYGNGPCPMKEEDPPLLLTEYGRSKFMMEQEAKYHWDKIPIVGLRYFNVFGPGEAHKSRAASMVYHLTHQMLQGKRPRLFEFGEQSRDFIYVKDVVGACLKALSAPSGIYNVGTGVATTFNDLVAAIQRVLKSDYPIEYFPMPYDSATYQACTLAEISKASKVLGFQAEWPISKAVADYVSQLKSSF